MIKCSKLSDSGRLAKNEKMNYKKNTTSSAELKSDKLKEGRKIKLSLVMLRNYLHEDQQLEDGKDFLRIIWETKEQDG